MVMMIGGYGAVQAQTTTKAEAATKEFLGMKWGIGVGVIGGFGGDRAVEKASIVNEVVRVDEEGDLRPQMFLEMHAFLTGPRVNKWREYQRWKDAEEAKPKQITGTETPQPQKMPDLPKMGFGPFVALQTSDNKVIDSFSLGFMVGIRKDTSETASVNLGIGLSFDPGVQVLRGDLKDGQRTAEKEVHFKKESQFGWALMTSFTF
jgi:hypothetical protein